MTIIQSELSNVGRYYASMEATLRDPSDRGDVELFAPDCVEHGADGDRVGAEVIAWLGARRASYPGAVWTIELLTGVGDMVICQSTMRARHDAGGDTRITETIAARFVAGRIAESWRAIDECRLAPD